MTDFLLLQFIDLLNKALGYNVNEHNEKALKYVLAEDFTEEKAYRVNRLYVLNQNKMLDIVRSFKMYSIEMLGFNEYDTPATSSELRFFGHRDAIPQTAEQHIADVVQSVFWGIIGLENILDFGYCARYRIINHDFSDKMKGHSHMIQIMGQSYLDCGVKMDRILFLFLELFVSSYRHFFKNSEFKEIWNFE